MNEQFERYLQSLAQKDVAVLGLGVSNQPLIRLLAGAGARVSARDRKPREELGALADELESLGVRLRLGENYLEELTQTVIYRTPGLRPDVPALARARAEGRRVTSEMEDFFAVCPCPIIGVTGSDGKTTTTTLIAEMLKAQGRTVHLGGNIGRPLLAEAGQMASEDVAVVELSSFQLMTMTRSPGTAVVTNVAPNHLDVHTSMEEYANAKENIVRFQGAGDLVVLNADCALTREMANRAPGRVRFFSRLEERGDGVRLSGDVILLRENGREEVLLRVGDIRLPGRHNLENYMAACAAVWGRVQPPAMRQVARAFAGVPHRLEFVAEVGGVRCFNDSIASSPTRTIAGLRSFSQKVLLIAGGYDKHIPFDALGAAAASHVKKLYLIGATASAIRACVETVVGAPPVVDAGCLETAVDAALQDAAPGDILLLSPACASFDQFPNFEARGQRYKELILQRLEA